MCQGRWSWEFRIRDQKEILDRLYKFETYLSIKNHQTGWHMSMRWLGESVPIEKRSPPWARAESLQSFQALCHPMDCSPQALLSMGFSRQEYWSGLPWPPSGDLPNPGIALLSPVTAALAGGSFTTSTNWEDLIVAPLPIPYILKGIQHKDYSSLAGCLRPYIFTSASQPAFQLTFRILFILYISPFLTHEQTVHTEFTS